MLVTVWQHLLCKSRLSLVNRFNQIFMLKTLSEDLQTIQKLLLPLLLVTCKHAQNSLDDANLKYIESK